MLMWFSDNQKKNFSASCDQFHTLFRHFRLALFSQRSTGTPYSWQVLENGASYVLQLMSLNCVQWCNAMESKVLKASHPNTQNGSALSLSLRNVVCKGLRASEAVCDARKQPKMQMYNWDARSDNEWVKTGSTNLSHIYSISGLVVEQVWGICLFCILCFFLFPLCWYECQVVLLPIQKLREHYRLELRCFNMHRSLARMLFRKLAKITWVFSPFQR